VCGGVWAGQTSVQAGVEADESRVCGGWCGGSLLPLSLLPLSLLPRQSCLDTLVCLKRVDRRDRRVSECVSRESRGACEVCICLSMSGVHPSLHPRQRSWRDEREEGERRERRVSTRVSTLHEWLHLVRGCTELEAAAELFAKTTRRQDFVKRGPLMWLSSKTCTYCGRLRTYLSQWRTCRMVHSRITGGSRSCQPVLILSQLLLISAANEYTYTANSYTANSYTYPYTYTPTPTPYTPTRRCTHEPQILDWSYSHSPHTHIRQHMHSPPHVICILSTGLSAIRAYLTHT